MKLGIGNKIILAVTAACILGIATIVLFAPVPKAHAASQFATIVCDNFKPLSLAADTQIITAGNANMFIYICSLGVVAGTADNFSVVEGTGSTCGTNTAAVIGGTTAASGLLMGLNGVFTEGSGVGAIAKTAVAGDNVCILRSSAGPLSGSVAWTTAAF